MSFSFVQASNPSLSLAFFDCGGAIREQTRLRKVEMPLDNLINDDEDYFGALCIKLQAE